MEGKIHEYAKKLHCKRVIPVNAQPSKKKKRQFQWKLQFYTAFAVNVRVNERERICILFRINFMVMAKFCNNLRVTLYRFSHRNEMIFYTKGTFLPNGNFHTLHTIHIPRPCNGTLNLGVRFGIVYLRILYLIVNSFFCFVHHFYIKLKTLIYDCNLFNNAKTEKQSRMTFGRQCNKKNTAVAAANQRNIS